VYTVCIATRSYIAQHRPPTNLATCCASVSSRLFRDDSLWNSSRKASTVLALCLHS
jgi:hypothetical protein